MYLDDVLTAQKRGEALGIASVCSAHPFVLKQTLQVFETPLIEATCNQVNQYGGYTGMTPKDFVAYVRDIAAKNNFPFEKIILGGDHLGPNVWQHEPAESALQKSEVLIREYVQAGFTKIHLDCSMKLGDDPAQPLDVEVIAGRAARLAQAAEHSLAPDPGLLRYVIGTEVPIPGGATVHEEGVVVTNVSDVRETIEVTRDAFYTQGLQSAWERVIAVVVQPGVEFGDDFVLPYQRAAARELSHFIEAQALIYEAHSTDYQTRVALKELVQDHFGILKVGPGLTFAFREAVFALAAIEDELISSADRSNILRILEDAMLRSPGHWKKYYHGNEEEQAYKRKFSLSDRIRYYWVQPEVQHALAQLMMNLGSRTIPDALLKKYVDETGLGALQVIESKINNVLAEYHFACQPCAD